MFCRCWVYLLLILIIVIIIFSWLIVEYVRIFFKFYCFKVVIELNNIVINLIKVMIYMYILLRFNNGVNWSNKKILVFIIVVECK